MSQKEATKLIDALALTRSAFSKPRLSGLKPLQMQVLLAVYEQPGASVRGVAERLSVIPSNVSAAVSGLVEVKLLSRADDPSDPRRSTLQLSKRGGRTVSEFLDGTN